ncbi:hypothetical protein CI736_16890 [Shigella boydii]|nr:hypothetical protein [Salmonella enterica subsp. enterica]OYJ41347.1 hypothetical protein CI736_16890 [Shigella boydii]
MTNSMRAFVHHKFSKFIYPIYVKTGCIFNNFMLPFYCYQSKVLAKNKGIRFLSAQFLIDSKKISKK